MPAFKGILKYTVYLFVGGWMFFLGIMVGRGTSPVAFDTQKFNKRLETIVREYGKRDDPEEKMDLQFYDALNRPARQEVKGEKNNPDEIIPKKETGSTRVSVTALIPVKTSRKAATLNKTALNKSLFKDAPSKYTRSRDKAAIVKTGIKKEKQPRAKDADDKVAPGMYTIQVAAYKSFADAVTQMAILEKKGFVSHRTLGKKEGVTWYRVRVGSFATRDAASLYAGKLKQAKIDAMIIKKE